MLTAKLILLDIPLQHIMVLMQYVMVLMQYVMVMVVAKNQPIALGYNAGLLVLYPPAQAYKLEYQKGLNNQTLDVVCPSTVADYSCCYDGFNAGRIAMEKPTVEYQFGFNAGKNDRPANIISYNYLIILFITGLA